MFSNSFSFCSLVFLVTWVKWNTFARFDLGIVAYLDRGEEHGGGGEGGRKCIRGEKKLVLSFALLVYIHETGKKKKKTSSFNPPKLFSGVRVKNSRTPLPQTSYCMQPINKLMRTLKGNKYVPIQYE